jgi:hypothetical protein
LFWSGGELVVTPYGALGGLAYVFPHVLVFGTFLLPFFGLDKKIGR